jgi:hypothetical protein
MFYLFFIVVVFSLLFIAALMYIQLEITGPNHPLNPLIIAGYIAVSVTLMLWIIKALFSFFI